MTSEAKKRERKTFVCAIDLVNAECTEKFLQGVEEILHDSHENPTNKAMKKWIRAPSWRRPTVNVCLYRLFEAVKNQPLPLEYTSNPEFTQKQDTGWREIIADMACVDPGRIGNLLTKAKKELGLPTRITKNSEAETKIVKS